MSHDTHVINHMCNVCHADLERRERELLQEQQFIRGDVQRLSLQLEELSQLIQVHIARNTACLDFGSLQKR